MNTSQLYIDFDSGGILSVYQQAPTHPVDTNTVKQQDSSYYSLPEEMMTVQVSDPRSKVIPERRSPGDGQEPRRYVTTDATLFNRQSWTLHRLEQLENPITICDFYPPLVDSSDTKLRCEPSNGKAFAFFS
ncbi:hypothetical protein ECG_08656 [Echinococcus granulosus]|nr:hypothetical protein ECG_08656 [Echinococcus granulosus]